MQGALGNLPLRPIRNGETTYPTATLVNLAVALGPNISRRATTGERARWMTFAELAEGRGIS